MSKSSKPGFGESTNPVSSLKTLPSRKTSLYFKVNYINKILPKLYSI